MVEKILVVSNVYTGTMRIHVHSSRRNNRMVNVQTNSNTYKRTHILRILTNIHTYQYVHTIAYIL